jgi:cytochrome c-type biogenesis protein CcmI
MTVFWIGVALMLVLAACLIIVPLMSKTQTDDVQRRDSLNTAFFKQRLSELEQEEQEGLVANKAELVTELQQSLLHDVPLSATDAALSPAHQWNRPFVLFSVLLMLVASGGMYYWLGSYHQVAKWQQVTAQLPQLSARLHKSGSEPLSDQELDDLSLALRTRLYDLPNDAMGWMLLGKISLANLDASNAIAAIEKAYALEPSNSSIRYAYAQALMAEGEESNRHLAVQLLNQLIQSGSTDIRVFSLLALNAYDNKQYSLAIDHWRKMQTILGTNDTRYAWLEQQITHANTLLQQESNLSKKQVNVTIALGSDVKITSNMVMIVSVHDEMGSPMPVAAVRLNVPDFPVTVSLDDRNSLIEQRLLSSLERFIVRVRLDQDGNVATKEGDYYGENEEGIFEQTVEVEVNKQY